MALKQSLELRMGQQLTLTPQLQQAIQLLQLSTLELQLKVQEELEGNPMLEVEEDFQVSENPSEIDKKSDIAAQDNALDLQDNKDIPEQLSAVDTDWEDVYQSLPSVKKTTEAQNDFNIENRHGAKLSIYDHLLWQLQLTPFTQTDEAIAMAIIDSIDDSGFLRLDLADLQENLNQDADDDSVELDEIEAVLKRVQAFDPPGIGARDIQECLGIQLQQLAEATPYRNEALKIINGHMSLLGTREQKQLLRLCKLNEESLQGAIQLIKSLNPRPGSQIADLDPEYIVPDLFVRKDGAHWQVRINEEVSPKLKINNNYASLVQRANNSSENTFLKNHLQEARWFLKSLQSRNETLLKVGTAIVQHQQDFLEHGEEAMRPLILHDIAKTLDMHESTISRVTTGKYIHTPRGIYELKYFFSSHVSTDAGGECSSTAIRAFIKKLVAAENHDKPLSDNKIAELLKAEGIKVARRTITKYREALNIPPSHERKQIL